MSIIPFFQSFVKASIIAALVVFLSCFPPGPLVRNTPDTIDSDIPVRVLLARSSVPLSVSADDSISVYSTRDRALLHRSEGKNIKFSPDRLSERVTVRSEDGHLYLNEVPYRGALELYPKDGSILVINVLNIDEYLSSVVPSEIPSSWPAEALKAQAVAARTYTLYHIKNSKNAGVYNLDATTNFQVYKGMAAEDDRTNAAVYATAGRIIADGGEPICAYFHSTCGGKTADDSSVWLGNDLEYLEPVECGYCTNSPSYEWTVELDLDEIQSALKGASYKTGKIMGISFHKKSGRVTGVRIVHSSGTVTIPGNNFRMLFPGKKIKSLYMYCEKNEKGLTIHGRGWGHGVGLCQYGARGMAEEGKSYRKILEHYYSKIDIISIDDTIRTYLANY